MILFEIMLSLYVHVYEYVYHGTMVHVYLGIVYVPSYQMVLGTNGTMHGLPTIGTLPLWFVRTYVRTRVRTFNVMSQLSDWKRAHMCTENHVCFGRYVHVAIEAVV